LLSFVVQNFNSHTPYLIRTKKYLSLILVSQIKLIFLLLRHTVSLTLNSQNISCVSAPTLFLFNENLAKTYWSFFKRIKNNRYGLVTNNLTKGAIFWSIENGTRLMASKSTHTLKVAALPSNESVAYYRPYTVLGFAFQKSTFNSLMFYIFLILSSYRFGTLSSFTLKHGFL
jgi:hypothetical protein